MLKGWSLKLSKCVKFWKVYEVTQMGKRIDLTGKRFGKLTVIEYSHSERSLNGSTKAIWKCQCDCGKEVEVPAGALRSGHVKSCGCLKHEHSYNFEDLTGMTYGRLYVLGINRKGRNGKIYYDCICECGNYSVVSASDLKQGHTKSCGCFQRESSKERHTTHGLSYSKVRMLWRNMISRCECEDNKEYHNYGGRGIEVCREWHNLDTFATWAYENGFDEQKGRSEQTIDRIDNNGNYCPENCRFTDMVTQSNNKRNNRRIICGRETHTLAEWSKITGINRTTISARLNSGMSEEEALGRSETIENGD